MVLSLEEIKAKLGEKRINAVGAFSSWAAFKKWIVVPDTALDEHSHSKNRMTWSNVDLDPTPESKRNWRWWNCKERRGIENHQLI
jgi:NCS1 family nucleobase:cation symporter-1